MTINNASTEGSLASCYMYYFVPLNIDVQLLQLSLELVLFELEPPAFGQTSQKQPHLCWVLDHLQLIPPLLPPPPLNNLQIQIPLFIRQGLPYPLKHRHQMQLLMTSTPPCHRLLMVPCSIAPSPLMIGVFLWLFSLG